MERSFARGGAPSWRFSPSKASLAAGGSITAINRGGEFHTFTEVAAFGGGCVDELNAILGLTPVPECGVPGIFGATGLDPGASLKTAPLAAGTHLFICLLSPEQKPRLVMIQIRCGDEACRLRTSVSLIPRAHSWMFAASN